MWSPASTVLTALAAAALALPAAAPAAADHGGPLRAAPMSPLLTAVLLGALALVAGFLVLAIVMRITRKSTRDGAGST